MSPQCATHFCSPIKKSCKAEQALEDFCHSCIVLTGGSRLARYFLRPISKDVMITRTLDHARCLVREHDLNFGMFFCRVLVQYPPDFSRITLHGRTIQKTTVGPTIILFPSILKMGKKVGNSDSRQVRVGYLCFIDDLHDCIFPIHPTIAS